MLRRTYLTVTKLLNYLVAEVTNLCWFDKREKSTEGLQGLHGTYHFTTPSSITLRTTRLEWKVLVWSFSTVP